MNPITFWKTTTCMLAGAMIMVVADEPRRDTLPPATVALLKRHYPDCHISSVDRDNQRGERIFRVRLEDDSEKQNILAKISEAGDLLELDEDISEEALPQNVAKAFRRAFPNADIRHVEKGTLMDISYRIDIEERGRRHEVKISRRGRIFEVESRD